MSKKYLKFISLLFFLLLLYSVFSYFSIVFSSKILHVIIFYVLGGIVFLTRNRVIKWISIPLNTHLLPIVRVLYGVLCLYSAIQHITLIPSGMEPYNFLVWGIETPSFLAYFLSGLYIIALVFIITGYRLRFAWVLLFITGGFIIPFSLEIFVKNIFNFYAIFIPASAWLGQKTTKGNEGWPFLLMGLSYSFLMTSAGIFKLLDPVWQEGLGLYYSLNIPFFLPRYLWGILDSEILMRSLNWITLIVELICLPLFFFKKTRIYALLSLLGLGFFLTIFMEGIGVMGGPIILVGCLAILSLTKFLENQSTLKYINNFLYKNVKVNDKYSLNIWLGVFIFWWSITGMYVNFYKHIPSNLSTFPPRYGNYTIHKEPLFVKKTNYILKLGDKINYSLKKTRPNSAWEFIWSLELFDYHHLFDRVYFRVVFFDEHHKMYEPIKYFDKYGAISYEQPLPGNEKFILSAFRIMDAIRKETFIRDLKLQQRMEKELQSLIKYSSKGNINNYKYAKIQIKQIFQPYDFQGNYKKWGENEWNDFYEYDFTFKKGVVSKTFSSYDYSKLKINVFKNKLITPNF